MLAFGIIIGATLGATITLSLVRLVVLARPAVSRLASASTASETRDALANPFPLPGLQTEAQEATLEAVSKDEYERYFDSPAGLGRV